jgi:hypothetical protein
MARFPIHPGLRDSNGVRVAVAVGGRRARGRPKRVRDPTGSLQDETTARCGLERCCLVDHRIIARETPDLVFPYRGRRIGTMNNNG